MNRTLLMEYNNSVYIRYIAPNEGKAEIAEAIFQITGQRPNHVTVKWEQFKILAFFDDGALEASIFPNDGGIYGISLDDEEYMG